MELFQKHRQLLPDGIVIGKSCTLNCPIMIMSDFFFYINLLSETPFSVFFSTALCPVGSSVAWKCTSSFCQANHWNPQALLFVFLWHESFLRNRINCWVASRDKNILFHYSDSKTLVDWIKNHQEFNTLSIKCQHLRCVPALPDLLFGGPFLEYSWLEWTAYW